MKVKSVLVGASTESDVRVLEKRDSLNRRGTAARRHKGATGTAQCHWMGAMQCMHAEDRAA